MLFMHGFGNTVTIVPYFSQILLNISLIYAIIDSRVKD